MACIRMETGTFLDDNVQQYMNRYFVALKYESGKDGEQFMRFAVAGTPTCIIFDGEGNEVQRFKGYLTADDFVESMEDVRDNY
jgi:thioredoxin-related protein